MGQETDLKQFLLALFLQRTVTLLVGRRQLPSLVLQLLQLLQLWHTVGTISNVTQALTTANIMNIWQRKMDQNEHMGVVVCLVQFVLQCLGAMGATKTFYKRHMTLATISKDQCLILNWSCWRGVSSNVLRRCLSRVHNIKGVAQLTHLN